MQYRGTRAQKARFVSTVSNPSRLVPRSIIGSRVYQGVPQFEVVWDGRAGPTWHDADQLDCLQLVESYERGHEDLGITAVEFLPVQQFDPTTGNYWGYEPLFFFAPHSAYAATKKLSEVAKEFKTMVDAFHKAGIQVFLDVVYNHTGEGNETGPKQSLKLIDNSTYYLLSKGCHANYSGTGNTLHTKNPVTTALTVGSLRYWVTKMGIDGFRFDLASVLSLNSDHTVSPAPPVFAQIASDPTLAGIHFIAEPWSGDGNQDLYQLGSKFAGFVWRQWNAEYRETIQKFINKQEGIRKMNDKIYGSEGLFNDTLEIAKKPFMSVNYIVSHDGFTLYDLVSYEHKKNEDGTTDHSWNWGHDGDIDVPPDVMQLRKRQMKNFIAILMISNGTPMLKAGDEFGQTQGGYNNPYNQDNEYSWLNWDRLKDFADVHAFTRGMIAFRKSCTIFSSLPFWRESASYYGLVAKELEWGDGFKSYALYLNGAKWKSHSVYVLINAYWEKLEYTILEDGPWLLIADTFETSISSLETAKVLTSNKYVARERSVVVLARRYVQA